MKFELIVLAEFNDRWWGWGSRWKAPPWIYLQRECSEDSSGAGRNGQGANTASCPRVWPLLNHSITHVPSLAWNTARIGEKTSGVTVKYLKILRRKMLWHVNQSFLSSLLIMQTSFFFTPQGLLSSFMKVSSLTGSFTLRNNINSNYLLSICSMLGPIQRRKNCSQHQADTVLPSWCIYLISFLFSLSFDLLIYYIRNNLKIVITPSKKVLRTAWNKGYKSVCGR